MRVLSAALAILLAGCMDQDPFGVTTRDVAGSYALKRWDEGEVRYYLEDGAPSASAGDWAVDGVVLRLGWDRQHILVQRQAFAGGDTAWVVVDVARQQVSAPMSEADARRQPGIGGLRVVRADSAWAEL